MQRASLAILVLVGVVQCGAEDRDLPQGWEEALSLPVDTSECTGGDSAMPGKLVLMRDMGRLRATYEQAVFRCQQRVCAYRTGDGAGGARVLVQPCDMNPSGVTKCSCPMTIGFDIPGVEPGRNIELLRRWDRYGATSEPQPEMVASVRAP
jgi:hypothetical protein